MGNNGSSDPCEKRWFEKILPNFEASLGFFLHPKIPKNYVDYKTYGSHRMISSSHWLKISPPWCHGLYRFFSSPEDRLLFGAETQTKTSVPLEQEGKRLVCVCVCFLFIPFQTVTEKKIKDMPTKNTACGSVLSEFIQYEVSPCSSRLIWLQPLPAIFSAALNIWSPKFRKPFKAVGVHRSFIVCFVPCGPDAKRKEVVRFFLAANFFPRAPWCLSI